MEVQLGELVMPGDIYTPNRPPRNVIILGPGLRRNDKTNDLSITKPGLLRHKHPSVYWVDCIQNRYIPRRGDLVVGIVARRAGETFKVDIGAAEHASLSVYAFEGATKKQKPDIRVGDAIYAKVLSARKEMEPDLVCIDRQFKAKNLGKLRADGFVMKIPIGLTYRLLSGENELLQAFGKKTVFEVAIGLNGRLWINARTSGVLLGIMGAMRSADSQTNRSINDLCRRIKLHNV